MYTELLNTGRKDTGGRGGGTRGKGGRGLQKEIPVCTYVPSSAIWCVSVNISTELLIAVASVWIMNLKSYWNKHHNCLGSSRSCARLPVSDSVNCTFVLITYVFISSSNGDRENQ